MYFIKKLSLSKIFRIFIILLLCNIIIFSFSKLLYFSILHWINPSLYADSYRLVEQNNSTSFFKYLFSQHNEHRIVFSKLSILFEEKILKISPGQSSIFQNLGLVLLSSGIWTLININFFKNKNIILMTSISGIVLLFHPWQWQNFVWEFQVPWFFINALVLLGTLLLVRTYKLNYKIHLRDITIVFLPWFSIFSTGQGIALAIALSISLIIKNIRLALISITSTFLSLLTYFYFLNYTKPGFHPSYNFDLRIFFGILFGGIWHGLFVLIIIAIVSYIFTRPYISKDKLITLLFPSIFSIIFSFMTTLSRSEFGLRVAGSSRYTTHSLMMGLSAILLMGLIAESIKSTRYISFIGISTILITLGAFPQSLIFKNFRGDSFFKLWNKMYEFSLNNRKNFICIADKIAFQKKGIELFCDLGPHHKDLAPAYFKNQLIVKPIGWHKLQTVEALNNKKNSINIEYSLDKVNLLPNKDLHITGWIIAKSINRSREDIFLVANYGDFKKISFQIENKKNREINSLFDKVIPAMFNNNYLKNLTIETRNSSKIIWNNNKL